jgi:hypothetical protein
MLPGEFATVGMAHDSRPDEPATIQEAFASPAAECWQQAMTEELQSLHANKTWELDPLASGRTAVDCGWLFKIKRDADGNH